VKIEVRTVFRRGTARGSLVTTEGDGRNSQHQYLKMPRGLKEPYAEGCPDDSVVRGLRRIIGVPSKGKEIRTQTEDRVGIQRRGGKPSFTIADIGLWTGGRIQGNEAKKGSLVHGATSRFIEQLATEGRVLKFLGLMKESRVGAALGTKKHGPTCAGEAEGEKDINEDEMLYPRG